MQKGIGIRNAFNFVQPSYICLLQTPENTTLRYENLLHPASPLFIL